MKYNIALVKGDGIGPEIVDSAVAVLNKVFEIYGHTASYSETLAGGAAIDVTGEPLPQETIDICLASDSVLLGAVGGPKWDTLPGDKRPERALLGLRSSMGLFANIRPTVLFEELKGACPLKPELTEGNLDFVVVRELTGGAYFGERGRKQTDMGEAAYDTMIYSEGEVERIMRVAFEMAMVRGKKLCSVDKANVLESSRLWRSVAHKVRENYPEVEYSDMLVDNCAMQMIRNPKQFDVIVTENMFGDILSDEASMITGSIGMLPSASLGAGKRGMYEPIHGSAPDIAGKGLANPLATILSVAMMLKYSFGLEKEAQCINDAVTATLAAGLRTADIAATGEKSVGTKEMTEAVLANLK